MIMQEVPLEYIKKQWLDTRWRIGKMFNLYIDNPFCAKRCKFCIYADDISAGHFPTDIFNKYYNEYLPAQIELFSDIIELGKPDTVYFGGGTPSLMPVKTMERIFSLIPDFRKIPNKAMEFHPATLNKEKIDLVAEYQFSYISIGIQTFNNDLNRRQNRIPLNEEKLKPLVQYAREKGLHINMDLLVFMDTGTKDDLVQFADDLIHMANEYTPHIITIYPMAQRLYLNFIARDTNSYRNEAEKEHNYDLIINLRRVINKFIYRNRIYHICSGTPATLNNKEELLKQPYNNYFLLSIPEEEFKVVKVYSSSGYPNHPPTQNVLGLGGYGNRKPYSYHGGTNFFYHTVNDNWQSKFFLVQEERVPC